MGIPVKLQTFEGPLDLLLHLIDKNKVNIYDIPIVEITKQYLDYIREMERQDLNVVSEFLVMAATLLDIKSRMLLPAEEEEDGEPEDPRAELVERLLEYKMYKYMSHELKDLELDGGRLLYKDATIPKEVARYEQPVDLDQLLEGLTLARLQKIFQMVVRKQEDKIDPIRSNFGTIKKEPVSLEEKMEEILSYGRIHKQFTFQAVLEEQRDKVDLVIAFLAILELMKLQRIYLKQEGICQDIVIEMLPFEE